MLESDFKTYNLVYFSPGEIIKTGASLDNVKLELFVRLQNFRSLIGDSVHLIDNGLTTGIHKSPYHGKGLAVDFYLNPRMANIKILNIFKAALESGFKGIGIYWNGSTYSFHFDLRPKFAFWSGAKDSLNKWDYHKLIMDPKDFQTSGVNQIPVIN